MSDYLSELSTFSTCDVSDGLLNKYGDASGGFIPNLQKWSGPSDNTVAGKAYTVLFAQHDDPRPEINYIDTIPAGSFLVIALTIPLQLEDAPYVRVSQALYGGLMSRRAQFQGTKGTVVLGRIRDVEEQHSLEYPVYSYSLGTCASKMAVKPVAVQIPLQVLVREANVQTIHPDDYIIGDNNGIVRIPTSSVCMQDLMLYIRKSIEVDRLVAQDVAEGKPLKASQKERREVLKELLL
ncbi:LANO_0H19812g1_1 [Lachancea nothofagi CBS 11611]|uniref:LANO_0H19812g1_1 n=1 Tax=Lachancea nothofagi CBS 11611 TaxID=1266666 RepID=A0A1G4KNA4_9SACH|nr:LANO_0H19812g1_1 [Lachancea nothofagi CBS 11611]